MARAGELGADQALTFLREVDNINMRRRIRMVELAREVCDGSLLGKRVAVLGAAFKPDSDDIRDSPALNVAAQLQLQGAVVRVTDPAAVDNSRREWPHLRRPPSGPTPSWCSRNGSSTASSTRSPSARSWRRSGSSTGATRWTVTPGRRPAGATARSADGRVEACAHFCGASGTESPWWVALPWRGPPAATVRGTVYNAEFWGQWESAELRSWSMSSIDQTPRTTRPTAHHQRPARATISRPPMSQDAGSPAPIEASARVSTPRR
jgi:hypothetical protein